MVQLTLVAPLPEAPRVPAARRAEQLDAVREVQGPGVGLSIGAAVCDAAPCDAYVLAVTLDAGSCLLGRATMANPGEGSRPGGSPRTLFVRIGREVVTEELAAMLGGPADAPVRFETEVDLDASSGVGVLVEHLLQGLLGGHELLAHPHVLLRQVRTLAAALLLAQPHSLTGALLLGQSPPRPRTLRRALQHMGDNLSEPLTLADLAAAAGCSARTLTTAFGEHLGVSPMTYLRHLRLERVREDLLATDDPVGSVAYRWGFTHLGRFAGVYSHRFGELPSQTASRGG